MLKKIVMLLALGVLCTVTGTVAAEDPDWVTVFGKLQGWQTGMVMPSKGESNGVPFRSVGLLYQKGNKNLAVSASLMAHREYDCLLAQKSRLPERDVMGAEVMEFFLIKSYQAYGHYNMKTLNGEIRIELLHGTPQGMIGTVTYNHMTYDEALQYARRFDWKRIAEELAAGK
jgi:hypothetical protein